jgi:hypothetical protein
MVRVAGSAEVLAPALTRGEARSLEGQAKRHWRTASRNAIQFAAELRRLQDGQAHLVRGYDNFGTYAQQTFDGLSAPAAKQLSRQGSVLLVLERRGRIALEGLGENLPGTTALRALSAVQGNFGEQTMLTVYDRACQLRPGRAIVEDTVKAAMRDTIAPPPATGSQLAEHVQQSTHDAYDDDEEELPDELPEEIHELLERIDLLRGAVADLRLNAEDPITARRELTNVREELQQVTTALESAYGNRA